MSALKPRWAVLVHWRNGEREYLRDGLREYFRGGITHRVSTFATRANAKAAAGALLRWGRRVERIRVVRAPGRR